MEKQIKAIAIRFATLVFFLMAVTGAFFGQSPSVIAYRGAIGAVAIYIMVSIGGRIITNILVDEAVRNKLDKSLGIQSNPKDAE